MFGAEVWAKRGEGEKMARRKSGRRNFRKFILTVMCMYNYRNEEQDEI